MVSSREDFHGTSSVRGRPSMCRLAPELCVFEASSLKRRGLALCNAIDRKILYGFVEQLIEIQLGAQVQEHGAEPDRGAIHEDEFTRHFHRALLLEGLM